LDDAKNLSVNKNLPKEGVALYKGHFTTDESVVRQIAIKIYANRDTGNELGGYTSCVQRAQDNLEFLSLLGNEHPNLIAYYGHHKVGEKEIQIPQDHKKIKMTIPLKT